MDTLFARDWQPTGKNPRQQSVGDHQDEDLRWISRHPIITEGYYTLRIRFTDAVGLQNILDELTIAGGVITSVTVTKWGGGEQQPGWSQELFTWFDESHALLILTSPASVISEALQSRQLPTAAARAK